MRYPECNVSVQPNVDAEVVVAEFDTPKRRDYDPVETLVRVDGLLYHRESDYGNVEWWLVDPEYEIDEKKPPETGEEKPCSAETHYMLEAILTLLIDRRIGCGKNSEELYEPEPNLKLYKEHDRH